MTIFIQFLAGLVFGAGLIVSGMIFPDKVLNFLDIAGTWDASLAFVMGGAVAVTLVGYRYAFALPKPLLTDRFILPASQAIDIRLLTGATIFGVGWGLAGLCPGPAVTSLLIANPQVLIMVVAMLIGMAAARAIARR